MALLLALAATLYAVAWFVTDPSAYPEAPAAAPVAQASGLRLASSADWHPAFPPR